MLLYRLYNSIYPASGPSIWLGLRQTKRAQQFNFGVIFSVSLFIIVILLTNAHLIPLGQFLVWGGMISGIVLVVGNTVYTWCSRPWRVDLLPQSVNLLYRFRTRSLPISSIREIRLEPIRYQTSSGEKTNTIDDQQIVFDLIDQQQIKILRGRSFDNWTKLVDTLRDHQSLYFVEDKREEKIPFPHFGKGSINPWDHYLEGKSSADISSIEDIKMWLRSCKFVSDQEQFGELDHWLKPTRFETLKQGDCEDHALWAWKKLKLINQDAEFVVGLRISNQPIPKGRTINHAWLTLVHNGELFVFESTIKRATNPMMVPWDEAKHQYRPKYSVNHHLQTFNFQKF
ncbi:MAG: hypothetical protein AAGD96_24490 [Chloroflexota bacterium]